MHAASILHPFTSRISEKNIYYIDSDQPYSL